MQVEQARLSSLWRRASTAHGDHRAIGGRFDQLELTAAGRAELPFVAVEPTRLRCRHRGTDYAVEAARGSFARGDGKALRIVPDEGAIRLEFARR